MIVDGRPVIAPSDFPQGPKGPQAPESDLGFFDAISGPAWSRQNMVANMLNGTTATYDPVRPEDRIDVWSEIEGTKYEPHFDSFAPAVTREQVDAEKEKIDREQDDRRVIEEAGLGGMAAEMIATVVDLPTLIPGGILATEVRSGYGILRVGAATAFSAGAEAAAVEGFLHTRQSTRTAEESAFAIGGSIVLGGLLGSGLSAILGRTAEGKAVFVKASKSIQEAPQGFAGDLSAAARIQPEITDFDIPTAAARIQATTPAGLSFTDRFARSQSAVARKVGSELLGNEYAFAGTDRLGLEPAAEIFAGVTEDKMRIQIGKVFKNDYKAYRKASKGDTRKILSSNEYAERVSAAMRRGDVDPEYPEIAQAAEKLRREVVEPMKNRAVKMGLLPEGVNVRTATSYFTRMWDANRIVARSDEFLDRITEHFEGGMKSGAIRQQDLAQREASSLENELFGLSDEGLDAGNLDKQGVTKFLSEEGPIQKRVAEIRRTTNKLVRRPLSQSIRRNGGIDPKSPAAVELKSLGVTPQNSPGLFKKGGLKDVDNLDPLMVEDFANKIGIDRGFLSRQGVLDTIADEASGVARRSDADDALLEELDHLNDMLSQGRRLVDDADPGRRAALKQVKELKVKIERAREKARAAGIAADFTPDELRAFSRAAAEDVFKQLTDPGASPTAHLNITVKTRGPLNERTLNVRDIDYEDFLVNDAEFVLNRYARVMSAETELTRRFGSADMKDQIAEIHADYDKLRDAATTDKARVKLAKERRKVIKAMEAARDQVRGTYMAAERASGTYRTMQVAMTYKYVTALGDVVLSSLGDVFKLTMVNGFRPLVNDVLVPMIRNMPVARASQREISEAAGISEVLLNSRMMRMADITDPYAVRTPIEATMHQMGSKASLFSGIMHWNQFLKDIDGALTTNRLRRLTGNLAQRDERFLRRLKLTRSNLERIQEQMAAHGEDIDGIFVPNIEAWDQATADLYGAVVRASADTTIVTPGIGDKIPLVEEKWFLKPAMQFKSFALASHRKTLMVGMQEDKARFLTNASLMVSMGMFVYYLKSLSREKSALSDNPGVWLAEGIDRSGILPVFMEMNNMAERVGAPGVYYGLGSAFGDSPQRASRFQTRGVAGAALGPLYGSIVDATTLANAAFSGDIKPGDVGALRREIPFGNHPGIKQFLNLWAVPELKEAVK